MRQTKSKFRQTSITASSRVIQATDVSFKFLGPIETNAKTRLETKILFLISEYQLSVEEISGYLVEDDQIQETEEEIATYLQTLINDNQIQLSNETDPPILKLSDKNSYSEHIPHSREDSKKWINANTKLNQFFRDLRKPVNNIFKKLTVIGRNSYNKVVEPKDKALHVKVDGKSFITFSSNDYLGLSRNKKVIEATIEATREKGVGTGGSRILAGTTSHHRELEMEISNFLETEDTIVFNSGYVTNLAISLLAGPKDAIFFDALSHASIIDGIRLSGAKGIPFRHNDYFDLDRKLKKFKFEKKLVFVEGVYSMEGDICPLPQLLETCEKNDAVLALDEAHSFGTMGKTGRGIPEYFNISPSKIPIRMGTLGKSAGVIGGFISGHKRLIELLKYTSRPFLFSTSLPPGVVAGATKSIQLIKSSPELPQCLQRKSEFLRSELEALGFDIGGSKSQIIPLITQDIETIHKLQHRLEEHGFFVNAVMYPAVPKNAPRLRICLSSATPDTEISRLITCLTQEGLFLGILPTTRMATSSKI